MRFFHRAFFVLFSSGASLVTSFSPTLLGTRSSFLTSSTSEDDVLDGSTPGAELTSDMLAKVKASHTEDEERSGGGFMFRKMIERAESRSVLQRASPSSITQPPDMANLSVEEQARLFREMMSQNTQQMSNTQPPQVQQQPFPQAYPPQGVPLAPDGRKIGRNRDADAIVNTSDVYFAQLKTDSTSRILARMAGDDESANQVFQDPHIKEIKMHVNPHLEEMKKEELAMLQTSVDEMLLPAAQDEPVVDRSYAGIRYKDKLKERKRQMAKTDTASSPAMKSSPEISSEPSAAPSRVSESSAPFTSATSGNRSEIRTLMGLILKHRGGPGFGAGRLRYDDIQRFEQMSANVLTQLRQESGHESLPIDMNAQAPVSSDAPVGASKVESMVACLDGALAMYKNSPPELRDSVLVTLRAALLSAVTTCNEIVSVQKSLSSYEDSAVDIPQRKVPAEANQGVQVERAGTLLSVNDENSKSFERIYQRLKNSAGEGKLGLDKNLTAESAAELAEDIARMRSMLVEELQTGVPERDLPTESSSKPATSMYKDLLAKARQEKL